MEGTVSPSENPDALLAHNTFYVREGVPFVRNKMGGGTYTEEDNTDYSVVNRCYNDLTFR